MGGIMTTVDFIMKDIILNENKPKITNPTKVWWVQAEGLNSLLLMYKIFLMKKIL